MIMRFVPFLVCLLALGSSSSFSADDPVLDKKADSNLDRYGDPLPDHALMRIGTTRLRANVDNGGAVVAMAFTKDGKRLVTLSYYSGGQVWDAETGKKLLTFGCKPGSFVGIRHALSPDGSRAAIVESTKICRFYDTSSGKEIGSAVGDWEWAKDLRFSPDNKLLGVEHKSGTAVSVWDVARGSMAWEISLHKGSPYGAFAFTPDGKIIIFGQRRTDKASPEIKEGEPVPLLYYDAEKGPESEFPSPLKISIYSPDTSPENGNPKLAFSSDGKLLVARDYGSHFVLWDFKTGKSLHRPSSGPLVPSDPTVPRVWCLCLSPDARWIITGSDDGKVRLWDAESGKVKREFLGYDYTPRSLAISPDNKRVVAAGWDGTLRFWDIESGKQLFDFEGHRMRNVQAQFSGDGKTIISIGGHDPDGASEQRTYRIWEAATGKPLKQVSLDRKDFLPLCLSDDGRMLYVVDKGEITRRNLITDKVDKIQGLPADYSKYRTSADGRYLAATTARYWAAGARRGEALAQNLIRVVDTITGKEVLAVDGNVGEYFELGFTSDGRFLTVNTFCYELDRKGYQSFDLKQSYLTLWDLTTGRKIQQPTLLRRSWTGNTPWPAKDMVSPQFNLGVTRGHDCVELRELATNAKVAELAGESSDPACWAFSRDGKWIAMGNDKGQVVLWSISPPKAIATFSGHSAAVTSVHFSPDGQRLVSGSDDTTILVWDITDMVRTDKPIALSAEASDFAWKDLADSDAGRAYRAMGSFSHAGPQTVVFLREHLRRQQKPDAKQIDRWIKDLDDESFEVRDSATKELEKHIDVVLPALRKALAANGSLELRLRLTQLIEQAGRGAWNAEDLRMLRAIEVLEYIGTAEARAVLQTLADGVAEGRLTREAKASLDRLAR